MRRQAFTLIELIAIVVILSVVAAVGLPSYSRTMERSYWQEARDVLFTIYQGQRSHFLTHNAYQSISSNSDWREIYMDNPNMGSIPVTFTVTASGATFTATATKQGGACGGRTLQITQTRALTGTWLAPGDC